MVTYQQFMSVGMAKCGSDRDSFAGLAAVWSAEKDVISGMTEEQVREQLICP